MMHNYKHTIRLKNDPCHTCVLNNSVNINRFDGKRVSLPPLSALRLQCPTIPDITRNSAITDKPSDAFRGQSRSPNMVPFHMLGIWFPITVL